MTGRGTCLLVGVMLGGLLAGCSTPAATEVITAVPVTEEVEAAATEESVVEQELTATAEPEATEDVVVEETATPGPVIAMTGDPSTTLPALPVALFTKNEGADAGDSVWTWRPGGMPSLLAGGGSIIDTLLVSPDGEVAVFQRRRLEHPQVSSLWAVNTDGTNERELLSADDLLKMVTFEGGWGASLARMEFLPGTHILLFSTFTRIDAPGTYSNRDIWMLDVDSRALSQVREPSRVALQNFVVSPDGTQIAVVTEKSIGVMAIDGSSRTDDVFMYQAPPTGASYQLAEVAWSSDGTGLIVIKPPEDILGDVVLPHHLLQVPLDGSPPVDLSQFVGEGLFGATFNGNGSAFVYFESVGERPDNEVALHVVVIDEMGDTVALTHPHLRPRGWDAGHELFFAFTIEDRELYVIGIDGEAMLVEGVTYHAEDHLRYSVGMIDEETLLYISHIEGRSMYGLWQSTPGSVPMMLMEIGEDSSNFIPKLVVAH